MNEQKTEIVVSQFAFGTTNGTRQPFSTTKIRIRISKQIMKYIEATTNQDQTKSERICELIQKGLNQERHTLED